MAATKRLNNLDLNKNEIQNGVIQLLASDPGSPVNGQIWVNTTSQTLNIRLNGITIPLGRLDQLAAPTADVPFNSHKATGLLDPTAAQDAATKAYVDALVNGLDWKASVRAATTANIATLAGGAPSTLDGVTLALNDRILVKDQTTGSQNGIYTVTTVGTGANGTWTRATDADASAEVTSGMAVPVTEGTLNADTVWILTTNDPITLATTALVFSRGFTAPSTGTAKFSATIGDAAATSITVTDNLGSKDKVAIVRDAATDAEVECDIVYTSTTQTTFVFSVAPASNSLRVVIVG